MLELIINKEKDLEDIVLVQNGKMIEHYTSTEEERKRRLEGNIYVGRVGDIIKGMQAAFVEFGGEKKGFIHLKDAMPQIDETKEKLDTSLNINKVLKSNQKLLVQVKKDSDDKKGARVSTHISLPGKYIVLMPNTTFITISQKIENEEKRKTLRNIIKENLPKGFGAIIRTSAENISEEEIKKDIKDLLEKWKDIENKFNQSTDKPSILWESENVVEKMIIDLSDKKLEKITTNSEEEFKKLNSLKNKGNIEIILEKQKNLLEKYDLQSQIEKLENRKINLTKVQINQVYYGKAKML